MSSERERSKDLSGLSACVIVDGPSMERFAHVALEHAVSRGLRIGCVLICTNTAVPRKSLRHGAYYLYKLLFLRQWWTQQVTWGDLVPEDVPIRRFASEWEGIWQRVPADTIEEMSRFAPDVVLRFGMSLMRDPDALPARLGVLSYHHGDPAEYRGRPAGFYELLEGADHLGVMVQRLSNKLDAGEVLAYGSVKISRHSYRRTMEQAFGNGTYLLTKALRNARDGEHIDRATGGENRRLPANRTVLRFASLMLWRQAARLLYGLMREKRWKLARVGAIPFEQAEGTVRLAIEEEYPVPDGYSFLADPSVVDERTLICEALDEQTGVGRLVTLRAGQVREVDTSLFGEGHLSYPHLVRSGEASYLIAEMAQIGPQKLGLLGPDMHVRKVEQLRGMEDLRLSDPTLYCGRGHWWLFAGQPGSALDVLFLWYAESLTGPYIEHPDSPIVLDPACARMAGPIQEVNGRLFRLGQDNRRSYGDGVVVREISCLDPARYEERECTRLRVGGGRYGPHTYETWGRAAVIDLYNERWDAWAGLRRLRARVGHRRAL